MKMLLLTLALCSCMAGYAQTPGGGTGAGGGTTSGTSGSSGAGPAPSSGDPSVNTVGSPQNQYQSGTGAGAGTQSGTSGTAVGSGTTRQGLPGSPVNPGLPGSPVASGLPGFTNSMGAAGQGTNAVRNSATNFLGTQNVSSGDVQQRLTSLRGEIQQTLAILDSYNRSLSPGGTTGVGGASTDTGVGAGASSASAPLGNAETPRSGTGANLGSVAGRDFSRNLGANVSTPVGGSPSAASGAATVASGVGTGSGAAAPGAGVSQAKRGETLSSAGTTSVAGYPQDAGEADAQVQLDSARSLLLLQADLERTLDLLGSINVPELTGAAGAARSPQGTITGSGTRVQQILAPPGNLRIQGGTTSGSSGAGSTR